DVQRPAFAQDQQPGRMVNLAVHEHDRSNACLARSWARPQPFKVNHLLANIGRGIEQHPALAICAYRYRGLGAWLGMTAALVEALVAATIAGPLRATATCGRAENTNTHAILPIKSLVRTEKQQLSCLAYAEP